MNRLEKFSSQQESDIDLKPFINFLVVLIPVLMISAEFTKIAMVEASSSRDGSSDLAGDSVAFPSADRNLLGLTIIVSDSTITLGSNGGFLPTIHYREFHTYVSRDKRTNRVTVAYDARQPGITAINPETGKRFGLDEREDVDLFVEGENRQMARCLYAKDGRLVADEKGTPLSSAQPGEKVRLIGPSLISTSVAHTADFSMNPLSAYDALRATLLQIREREREAQDGTSIRIAAESSVIYDKIIQLMDVARSAGFPDISITKVRG